MESSHPSDAVGRDAPLVYRTQTLRPTFRSLLVAFLFHHNPFYLLSAFCMIAGCYALNSALDLRAGQMRRMLILLGTINLYEVLLLALGLFLIRSRGIIRDGRTLLLLQIVFLVDLTFLASETPSADRQIGIAISVLLLVLALAKVAAVLWALSPRFPVRLYSLLAAQLAALYLIPCVFAHLDRDGTIGDRPFYAVWWIVGLLAAAGELTRWIPGLKQDEAGPRPRLGGVYAVTIYLSLLAHMGMMHWVYRVTFMPADASPVFLGLALAAHRMRPSRFVPSREIDLLRFVLPFAAVIASLSGGGEEVLGHVGRFGVMPLELASVGAFLAYVDIYAAAYAYYILPAAAALVAIVIYGPTVKQLYSSLIVAWQWSAELIVRVMPKTAVQWGLTAVAGAFAFLGLGAILSLSQGKAPKQAAPAPLTKEGESPG